MEVKCSNEIWKKVHKHVLETANAADGSEVGHDFETISATENRSSANELKLKAEIEVHYGPRAGSDETQA
jgi:hypothetical protein